MRVIYSFYSFALVVCLLAGCNRERKPEPKQPLVGWRPLESWSGGSGATQTDSFNMESLHWRIRWEAKGDAKGTLNVMVHSEVSGRPIAQAVDQHGPGKGLAYVTEDPRLYHLVIESSGLDWSVAVEEGVISYP